MLVQRTEAKKNYQTIRLKHDSNKYDVVYVVFMCSGKTQDLEEQQPSVEQELRRLMDKPGEGLEETH